MNVLAFDIGIPGETALLLGAVGIAFILLGVAYLVFKILRRTFKLALRTSIVAAVLAIFAVGTISFYWLTTGTPSKPPRSERSRQR